MRIVLIASLLGWLAWPLAARGAAPAVKIKSLDCFYVSDSVVYSMKEPGRYELGKFRCQATLDVAKDGELPLLLELKQDGQVPGKASATTHSGPGRHDKVEVELQVPEEYGSCADFDLVMTVGSAKRAFHVKTSCPD